MVSSLIFLLLCGNIALNLGNAQKLPKGKRPNLKVYINTTGDSILMKFLRPDPNTKLEGFLLGYGSNSHSNQYFPLPAEGKSSQAEVDAEPKYLIVVRPVPPPSQKKKCSGKSRTRQPLQMVVGTLSPSSVFLSWGFLINPQYDWTLPSQCPNDRLYTVRYREKDKEKKWIFQICPATETVVENLKPNTIYEFGVKDNLEGGLWSRIFNHKTVVGTKNKGNGKIQSTYDQTHIVPAYIPKKIIPITIIKQVIQNVTHRAASKSPDRPSVGGTILVHLIIPGLNETTPKGSPPIMLDISETVKTLLAKNETLALPVESKTSEEGKIPAQPVPVTMETVQRTTSPTMTSVIEISETTLAPNKLPEFPQAKTPFSLAKPRATLASDQIQWIVPTAKTSDGLKVLQPHPATHDMQPVFSSTPTTDEPEISITQTAATTTLDSAPSKTSRTIEQPRATLAPNEVPLLPQKPKISASPEIQHTTLASTQTTSIPSTPKRRRPIIRPTGSKRVISSTISESPPKPKPTSHGLKRPTATLVPKEIFPVPPKPTTPPGPEVSQLTPAQESVSAETTSAPSSPRSPTTIALPKTKRPGHRRRPKTTPSPKAPLTQSALESVTLTTETTKTTLASKSPRSKTRSRKVKTTPRTSTIQTISAYEPVTHRTEASMTTLASQLDQSSPYTDPQLKRTLSPDVPEIKTAPGPGTVIITHSPTTLVMESSTFKTDTMVTTIAPGPGTVIITHSPTTTLAKIKTKPSHRKRPRPKTTVKPEKSQTKSVLTTALEPATLRTVTPSATLAPKVPTKTRRPRPGPGPHPRPHPRPHLPQTTTPSPEVPQTKPAPTEVQTNLFQTTSPYLEKPPITPAHKPIKQNRTKSPSHSKLKTTPSLPVPQTKPVSKIELESIAYSTTSPKATIAPKGPRYVHPIPKTSQSPDEQQTKAVLESITYVSEPPMETIASIETTPVPSKTLVLPKPDAPQTKTAPKQTTHAPPKMKTTPASVKPATKVSRPVTSKPKISPRPHASPTLPAPTERHISSSSQLSLSPVVSPTTSVPEENTIRIKQPKTTLAPITITLRTATPTIAPRDVHKPDPDVSQTKPVLEPVTFKIEPSKPTMAPIGTKSIPVKPKISPSPSQDVLQTTLAKAVHSTQEPATTKIPRKPKRTKTTQAPNKVYTTTIRKRPVRPDKNRTIAGADRFKPNGISQDTDYIKPSSGDINKHISAPKNVSLDATKKPGTVAKTHHPILPPPKPTRRKLQPPNVTGKPGSTGTILLPRVTSPPPKVTVKPTGPTVPKKIETEKKQPTASVTGEYGNLTDFSSSPTRETDSLGNQRFVAPHVRYIPKPENEPCSITDSMKRFPTEEVSEESPTSPPQNPPTNLTVVTVEGCSSFVILDWEKPQNDTVTEYEIRSKENGAPTGKKESIQTTNQTFSTIENLKPNTSYEFQVTPRNPLGEGPPSTTVSFSTESADPRVSEPISAGRDAIWTEIPFKSDSYSECKGKQYVKRTWYKKFVGVQLCNSLRYKIYLSDSLTGKFYNIGDQRGHGEDHCQFVDSFLDGRTGQQLNSDQLPIKEGYFRAVRQEPVQFGEIGGYTQINYVQWYECGTTIPGKW